MTRGEHCPVLQLCPTQSHISTPCGHSNEFLDQEEQQGWINPGWQLFWGEICTQLLCLGLLFQGEWGCYSQDVLDNGLVLLVPIPLLLCVPSIHKQTTGAMPHFLLKRGNFCDFTEISLHWPPTFSFLASSLLILFLALLLICRRAGVSQGQRTRWQFCPTGKNISLSAAVSHHSFPALSKEEGWKLFPTQPFKCLEVDSVELGCLGWYYFINPKMELLKAFVRPEMRALKKSWIWVLVCKT